MFPPENNAKTKGFGACRHLLDRPGPSAFAASVLARHSAKRDPLGRNLDPADYEQPSLRGLLLRLSVLWCKEHERCPCLFLADMPEGHCVVAPCEPRHEATLQQFRINPHSGV